VNDATPDAVRPEEGRPLAPAEAAAALGVTPAVLLRLEAEKRITPFRTPGGTRRYPEAAVTALRAEVEAEAAALLTSAQVAALFHVCQGTVRRYVKAGKLVPAPGPGLHFRFRADEVRALLGDDGKGGKP